MAAKRIVTLIIFLCTFTHNTGFNIYNNACGNYNDYLFRFWSGRCYYNPNVLANTPSMIKMNNYPLEAYTLTTRDGYILTIFRIPPRNNKKSMQPVFVMHGLLMNSEIWVQLGNRSLAFTLADEGYDVWLGTVRGSNFAKTHVSYKMSNREYWNFNLDSLAYFDVGEQLKFVAAKTSRNGKIIYVGHSMGTTLAFMYASGFSTEADGVLSGIVALAPVVYLKDLRLIDTLVEIAPALERELSRLHVDGLFLDESANDILVNFCGTVPHLCKSILKMFAGELTDQFRPDDLLLFFSHCPSSVSVQVLKQYMQFVQSGQMRRYDYGRLNNIQIYHFTEPVVYDLRHIKVPVYLFYGNNDALVSEESVKTLFTQLGSTKKKMMSIPKDSTKKQFNHLDFFMAKDIKLHLYKELLNVMQEIKRN